MVLAVASFTCAALCVGAANSQQSFLHSGLPSRARLRNQLILRAPRRFWRCVNFIKDFGESSERRTRDDRNQKECGCQQPLPGFREQCVDEEITLAATPEYPEALQALYWTYVASCFVERAWRFALPALVALLSTNFIPVATISFVGQVIVFVGGPMVGTLMDSMPRAFAFSSLSFMQIVSILISAVMVLHALSKGIVASPSALAFILQPWFVVVVFASAIDRITGLATGVAFERDWVVLLAGQTRSIALAKANAMLRRVDLICETLAPFLFGLSLSKYRPGTCVLIVCATAVVSLPILMLLVQHTYNLSKGVLDRQNELTHKNPRLLLGLEAFTQGWSQYLMQPVLPASLAYVLLSFNAVLAPGGLMTTYLTQRSLHPTLIGSFRGLCALMGFSATFLVASLIGRFGTLKAGALSLTFQALLLSGAVLLYLIGPMEKQVTLFFFLALVILSRLGQWAYDMVVAQILQTAVQPSKANLVSTTEMSLASFAELLMLAVAIVVNDVSHFGVLAAVSMTSVVGASCLYWVWLTNPATKALLKAA